MKNFFEAMKPTGSMTIEDKTIWEEGKVSSEIMELIKENSFIREAILLVREKCGSACVRHLIKTSEIILSLVDNEKMKVSLVDRKMLLKAALVHDVGKAYVPKEILDKRGKLSEEEHQIVHKHVKESYKFLLERDEEALAEIVVRHHETKGYPRSGEDQRKNKREGEKERRVPKPEYDRLARLLSIADIFESMGSRVYNMKKPLAEIVAERERELLKFDLPEEQLMIVMLEGRKDDPKYILQKETEKTSQEFAAYTAS